MPGQTLAMRSVRDGSTGGILKPSMEGRARARPNRRPMTVGQGKVSSLPSMEGRARARPNQWRPGAGVRRSMDPSMEGRARARPN